MSRPSRASRPSPARRPSPSPPLAGSPPALPTGRLLALVAMVLAVLRRVARRRRAAAEPPAGTLTAAPAGPSELRDAASRTLTTDDGVELHVEVAGDPDAAVTVVFSHGFTARLEEFEPQREALAAQARLVFYDQRGHGRSERGDLRSATIDRLGRDLAQVLTALAPQGPVVLVGHSMGGMTIMALADQQPELFGSLVAGVALIATSAGRLVDDSSSVPVVRLLLRLRLLPLYLWLLRLWAPLLERVRKRGTAAGRLVTRRLLFGDPEPDRDQVRLVQDMLEQTSLPVAAAFYPTFVDHDRVRALPALSGIPVLVLVGTHDRLTPAEHSRVIAEAVGSSADLVVVPGAGHAVNLTDAGVVNARLLALVRGVRPVATEAG